MWGRRAIRNGEGGGWVRRMLGNVPSTETDAAHTPVVRNPALTGDFGTEGDAGITAAYGIPSSFNPRVVGSSPTGPTKGGGPTRA